MTVSPVRVTTLRCEYLTNPLGLAARQPRLSWRLEASGRGVRQTACQVRVAGGDGDLWDSGQLATDQSVNLVYQGRPLASRQRVWWQVRVWDEHGQATAWSETATWEMGLLSADDWQAAWITPDPALAAACPRLRTTFAVEAPLETARAYVTSRGLYALELNGQAVSDWLFTPGWTAYDKRLQYQVYDVTHLLQSGQNALGATLADGWFRGRVGRRYGEELALLAQIVLTYADGRVQMVGSDARWKAAAGPILKSDIYDGEDYDARREQPGWSTSGYDDAAWMGVRLSGEPAAPLVAQMSPPVRRMDTLRPVSVTLRPNGEWVVNLGQNMVGWVRLRARGAAGATLTVRHAEILNPDGSLYLDNIRAARQTNTYTLSGSGEEVFEPHFTWQGFQYVSIAGYPGTLTPEAITGVVVHSDLTVTGHFECSHPLINQLQHNIVWGQKGNFLDIPTDCPQRDERLGWTGDAQVFLRTAAFNMDVAAFFTKWLRDLAAEQDADGAVPFVVPDTRRGVGATGWADAAVICPWTLYQLYGDERLLAEQYASMQAWVGYMRTQAGDGLIWDSGFHFGDWLAVEAPDPQFPNPVTDKGLIATAFFAYSTALLAQTAQRLGHTAEAAEYTALRAGIQAAFNREFVTPAGRLASNAQTAYVLALQFDLLSPAGQVEAARRLAADIRQRGAHLTTGFLGTSYLCHVLSDHGYLDLAYALLEQETYPSWLYPVTLGATTSWERWDNIRPDGSLQTPNANSFNHYAFGAIGDWLYRVVAGLNPAPDEPGYKRIVFRPRPGGSLTWARARLDSQYGPIESGWTRTNEGLELSITVPPNTEGIVYVPAAKAEAVTEDGQALSAATGVVEVTPGLVVIRVGSGQYAFRVEPAGG